MSADRPPRLMVLSASVGAGHVRAAEALAAAARLAFPSAAVEHHDALDWTSAVYRNTYRQAYLQTVKNAPAAWGSFYRHTDRREPDSRLVRILLAGDRIHLRQILKPVEEWGATHVLCTHFFPSNLLLARRILGRRRGLTAFGGPVGIVLTDHDAHRFWIHPRAHRFYCGSEGVAWLLQSRGIPADRVRTTGIPILPDFSPCPDGSAIRAELDLPGKKPVVLLLSGGEGVGPLDEIVPPLLGLPAPFTLVVVAGRNARLRERLAALRAPTGKTLRVLGFVTDMHRWMGAADLVVSKSGGLTTSECLSVGRPMVILDPIPGQEERNADYLLENGAALKATDPDTLVWKVRTLIENPPRRARIAEAARRLGRPNSALAVVRDFLGPATEN